jgi:TusA-related sulfurtransferase
MNSFDLRETLPFSMLQMVNHFGAMKIGDEMEIIGDNAETYQDIKKILPASDYAVVSEEFETSGSGTFRIVLKKINTTKPSHKGGLSCLKI